MPRFGGPIVSAFGDARPTITVSEAGPNITRITITPVRRGWFQVYNKVSGVGSGAAAFIGNFFGTGRGAIGNLITSYVPRGSAGTIYAVDTGDAPRHGKVFAVDPPGVAVANVLAPIGTPPDISINLKLNNADRDDLVYGAVLLKIIRHTGLEASQALILIPAGTMSGANLWEQFEGKPLSDLPLHVRVKVSSGSETLIVGPVVGRQDTERGIVLEVHDDRYTMGKTPLIGAWYYSQEDDNPVCTTLRGPHVNPSDDLGYGNCWERNDGSAWFTPHLFRPAYAGEDTTYKWTSLRFLRYLKGTMLSDRPQDFYNMLLPKLPDCITWPSIPNNNDRLKVELPNLDFSGVSFNVALDRCLQDTGYTYKLTYSGWNSQIEIVGIETSTFSGKRTLTWQTSGAVTTLTVPYKYHGEYDIEETCTTSYAEGLPYKVETSLLYDVADADKSTFSPDWTDADETAFQNIVKEADAGDLEARRKKLNEARQKYPRVYCCYKFNDNTAAATLLDGLNGGAAQNHPKSYGRLPDGEQALEIESGSGLRYPIRIRIKQQDDSWVDVRHNSGLMVDARGKLWLTGLTDDQCTVEDRVYRGDLINPEGGITKRSIKINLVLVADKRVHDYTNTGAFDPWGINAEVDSSMNTYYYKKSNAVIIHQLESEPAPGKGPFNETLDDSGTKQIEKDAKRGMHEKGRIRKGFLLFYAGMCPHYEGLFVDRVGAMSVNSPIASWTYDHEQCHTIVELR